ncbi:cell division protein FtsZ [Prosthecobacter dejongeii]|uniref:Cell division protein FtsZ n=2 Tax=Prosthecobacter dejongeii TaxID=48465 RepID=A0A7W7YLJ1_9BACT|nr:cell division protein FtsZ [Prosthecobacter dejongeii]MBB5038455.1 cell division protein FtsZ [Prosthecobacter dejongeii]
MVEYDRHSQREEPNKPALRTCIVGIGGAGSNVLDRITLDRTVEAQLVCMHTDIRVLGHAMAPTKIQLGAELMRGIGAGGDPDLGREAAMFSREEIRQAIEGYDIVFICAGLGGGTGSGAAPVIAEIAKASNALVYVTATMPFSFEGRRRLSQAEDALTQLQKRADALILFENNRMGELILPKDGIQKAFAQADQLIAQSLRAVSTIVSTPGLVKLGLDDLTSALSTSNGRCLFGFGEARGQNRGAEALKRALKSPLIDQGRLLHQTKTLLVHIAGGETLTLMEVDAVMKQLGRHVPDHTHILFGVAVDARLGDAISVTLISSLGLTQLNTIAAAAPPANMLPMTDRPMPSLADAVASAPLAAAPVAAPAPAATQQPPALTLSPAPAPRVRAPRPAPAPAPVAAPAPAPVAAAPEPQPAAVAAPARSAPLSRDDSMDLLFKDDEIISLAAPEAHTSFIADEPELFPEAPAAAGLPDAPSAAEPAYEEEEYYDEEEPSASHASFAPEPEYEPEPEPPAPAPAPPVRERLRIEDFMTPAPAPAPAPEPQAVAPAPQPRPATSPLAAVVARTNLPAEDLAYAPPANMVVAKKPTNQEQIDLGFSDQDRGRFKDTEPAIASGGEDLDVPTWMRLKRKLKR